MKKDGMGFPRVGTPEQDHIGVFSFTIRTGAATRAEDRRQTGDAGRVSSAVTTIDVVGPHYGADELLGRIVQLVCCLGTAEHAEIAWIIPRNRFLEGRCDAVHCFIPRGRTVGAIVPYKRVGQSTLCRNGHKTNLPLLILTL
jgi:hypothetical protein